MARRPRLLDMFCKAGGAGEGYRRAGFDVVGVDIEPQPNNPHDFLRADVFALDDDFLAGFDAFHASPVCKGYTELGRAFRVGDHPLAIGRVRRLLQRFGKPYVIENVPGAAWDMKSPVTLCGSMFGLGAAGFQLRRHRLFECSFPLAAPTCAHESPTIGVYGGHVRCRSKAYWRTGGADFPGHDKPKLAAEAMGIGWPVTMDELSQAIPPAFTQFIGAQLLAHLRRAEAA